MPLLQKWSWILVNARFPEFPTGIFKRGEQKIHPSRVINKAPNRDEDLTHDRKHHILSWFGSDRCSSFGTLEKLHRNFWSRSSAGWIVLFSSLQLGRLTWNIIMEVWKINFLSKWVICRFHVNLPGCIPKDPWDDCIFAYMNGGFLWEM